MPTKMKKQREAKTKGNPKGTSPKKPVPTTPTTSKNK